MGHQSLLHSRLLELVRYDPETGFFWRLDQSKRRYADRNKPLGGDNGQGYLVICLERRRFLAHRLAVFYMTGIWPKDEIDHINGSRDDNRYVNLREVSGRANTHNQRKAHKNSSTGFLGVRRLRGRFTACIDVNRVRMSLGTYGTPEEAHAAYLAAKRKFHPSCTI